MARSPKRSKAAKKKKPEPPGERAPLHGTKPGDRVSGDRLLVTARKHDTWESFRRSSQHHGYRTIDRMGAEAIVEMGYKNVRK